ncbi:hypothetical protein [Hyphomonas johnsonii]|uniref:Alkaline proteinase inhibitor/ Outer membrane lipoprotein Omp19 domain-containing protein n=1 Tax=Hyphomonas johnsonii MHS-2 TaxID=1280950 RepID=A0A059FVQ8_9PROT|nr:hypothetical protein [Hyphomonas johnsonii]KCZ94692.1 hypothetical protein HJO_04930 [Hyphomonas johnsonii MHS-2]
MLAAPVTGQETEQDDLATTSTNVPEAASRDALTPGLSSPGPSVPIGGISTDLAPATITGEWTIVSDGAAQTANVRLLQRSGTATGDVDLLSDWPFNSEPPKTWIYLGFGQLTLVDQHGVAAWSGQSENGDTLVGAFSGKTTKSRLVREQVR